jgi:hypothetical protein
MVEKRESAAIFIRRSGRRRASPKKGDEFWRMLFRDRCALAFHRAATLARRPHDGKLKS